ncbi:crotonyl-CoA carboxylase/reductase [Amycolatopsis australiensis]|uniref:Crotonyl-CoA carboxylase/reductase n=1 Tax=Amycolatopsis australiensis TaxID=546364 RepID=A0A1K1SX90_9PSEU|nr:crotonyl-CoA carboxylase/reductase [Amycolatopsis australiensis]SFW88469.1 crotonyl-CoA carboxylase/reductase [Amycolatopsis australiensis]
MSSLATAPAAAVTPADPVDTTLPADYVAAHLRVEDVDMFRGVGDKDVRKSLRVGRVPMPELAPDEVLIGVQAAAVNYNTVWSSMFEPLPTFKFLAQYGKQGGWAARHDRPYHVVGSDAAGVVVRTGSNVRRWKAGDHVVVNPIQIDPEEPEAQADAMLGDHRAWGFETNFGSLAEYSVVRASQLLPKPAHLTWEEAAANPLCAGTAYRMLVGDRGARIKQGDVVLIWGAAGGLGAYAVQFVKNGGGIPVGVVSSGEKAEFVRRLGCDVVIDRTELGLTGRTADDPAEVVKVGKRLGGVIRRETGEDPHVVFEHTGRATFGVSMFVLRRGGAIVTCGSSSGYQHAYDNRYLWMRLKKVIGSHASNLLEATECNRLFALGRVVPALSALYPLSEVAGAARQVQENSHFGKVGVLCQAPRPGLGVTDPDLRARIGEERLNPARLRLDGWTA